MITSLNQVTSLCNKAISPRNKVTSHWNSKWYHKANLDIFERGCSSLPPVGPEEGLQPLNGRNKLFSASYTIVVRCWYFSKFSTSSLNGIQRNFTGSTPWPPIGWFSTSLQSVNGIQQHLAWNKIITSSTEFVFFGPTKNRDGHHGLWLVETFSISCKKFGFFGPIGKPKLPLWPLIGWDIFLHFLHLNEISVRIGVFIIRSIQNTSPFPLFELIIFCVHGPDLRDDNGIYVLIQCQLCYMEHA